MDHAKRYLCPEDIITELNRVIYPDKSTTKIASMLIVDDSRKIHVAINPDFCGHTDPPPVEPETGVFMTEHSVVFQAGSCWEYKCGRYGCYWRPVPCP